MLRSMTAYADEKKTTSFGRISVEIQSVNRRYLDIKMHLPPELRKFEHELHAILTEKIYRGQLHVKVGVTFSNISPVTIQANLPIIKELEKACHEIATELSLEKRSVLDKVLFQNSDLLLYENELSDEYNIKNELEEVTKKCLTSLIEMKQSEGSKLTHDISARLDHLHEIIANVDQKKERSVLKQRDKLETLLNETFQLQETNKEVMLREICLFADKVDITEEIVRFKSHLSHFLKTMKEKEGVGKKLDFILQELVREINTIGAKSADHEISELVVVAKAEIERIREQIQNVE